MPYISGRSRCPISTAPLTDFPAKSDPGPQDRVYPSVSDISLYMWRIIIKIVKMVDVGDSIDTIREVVDFEWGKPVEGR